LRPTANEGAILQIVETAIPDVVVLKPRLFTDARGYFFESYSQRVLADLGIRHHFVQDNHSFSRKNVLRGLHYQTSQAQGKLVRVVTGEIFDVAVDLRRDHPTFGKWVGIVLSADSKEMFWVPPGFAHGFLVLSQGAEVLYKATEYYAPEFERTIRWDDPDLGIQWPPSGTPELSLKDQQGAFFRDADVYAGVSAGEAQ
jgi:dTDP-4-dehydrorhamnose 3,5-epimerase